MKEIHDKIIIGLKDFVHGAGYGRVIVGLSGGIDSAVTATLAVKALGRENVLGVLMPSHITSGESVTDAERLAKNLGIMTKTIPITAAYDVLENMTRVSERISKQNLQARIRGTILMTLSNEYRMLVLCTGNKSEITVGYCTMYGDSVGSLAPIAELTKTNVYRMANFLNKDKEFIPREILTKKPSAELETGQNDEDAMGITYEELDRQIEQGELTGIAQMLNERNAWKQKQLPEGISID